jgi:hypothetical protein
VTVTSIGTIPDETTLNVVQGQSFTFDAILTEDDDVTPRDLTGWIAHMQIRTKQAYTGTLLIDLSSPGDSGDVGSDMESLIIQAGGQTGRVDVVILPTVTALLTKTVYYYDLFLTSPDGRTSIRMLWGTVNVSNSVTQAGT